MNLHAPLIIDVAGLSLTDADRQRLAHPLVGGVILFGRNWQGRCLLYTSPSPRDLSTSRMPSSA